MPRLSEEEFVRTIAQPMRPISADEDPPFDFWDYVDDIPAADFEGHDCSEGNVGYARRHPNGRLLHVAISSTTRDVFMVLVIDQISETVVGHRLLDLPLPYGLRTVAVPAGDFAAWLRATEAAMQSGFGGADVPCGDCRGCCTSSMFIHIQPAETETLRHIPRPLLFAAPGRPKGHVLMGYNDHGHCPMLVDRECSIYPHRPQTCREYDCRLFAATGIAVDEKAQPEIARRVEEWEFQYENEASREEHRKLQGAAAFLQKNKELFPPGLLPSYPNQLAALTIRIYRLFAEDMTDAARIEAITELLTSE